MSSPVIRGYYNSKWFGTISENPHNRLAVLRNLGLYEYSGKSWTVYSLGDGPSPEQANVISSYSLHHVLIRTSRVHFPEVGEYPLIEGVHYAVVSDEGVNKRVIEITGCTFEGVQNMYMLIRAGSKAKSSWGDENCQPRMLIRFRVGSTMVVEIESSVIPSPGSRVHPAGGKHSEFKTAEEPPIYIYEDGYTIIEIQVAPVS